MPIPSVFTLGLRPLSHAESTRPLRRPASSPCAHGDVARRATPHRRTRRFRQGPTPIRSCCQWDGRASKPSGCSPMAKLRSLHCQYRHPCSSCNPTYPTTVAPCVGCRRASRPFDRESPILGRQRDRSRRTLQGLPSPATTEGVSIAGHSGLRLGYPNCPPGQGLYHLWTVTVVGGRG